MSADSPTTVGPGFRLPQAARRIREAGFWPSSWRATRNMCRAPVSLWLQEIKDSGDSGTHALELREKEGAFSSRMLPGRVSLTIGYAPAPSLALLVKRLPWSQWWWWAVPDIPGGAGMACHLGRGTTREAVGRGHFIPLAELPHNFCHYCFRPLPGDRIHRRRTLSPNLRQPPRRCSDPLSLPQAG